MLRLAALPILLAALLLPAGASARVEPGVGIGGVRLGMTERQAVAARGTPTEAQQAPDGRGGVAKLLSWTGLTAVVSPGPKVTSVSTQSRSERLSSGVGVGSTERALRRNLRVQCGTFSGRRSCTRVAGRVVTVFTIGPKSRRIVAISISKITG